MKFTMTQRHIAGNIRILFVSGQLTAPIILFRPNSNVPIRYWYSPIIKTIWTAQFTASQGKIQINCNKIVLLSRTRETVTTSGRWRHPSIYKSKLSADVNGSAGGSLRLHANHVS